MDEPASRVVAIIEDDPRVRVSLADLLQSASIAALTYSSAEEFLQSGDPKKISCLISDVRLPGMNGVELLQKMKHKQPELPIVLITGHRDRGVRERALQAGAAAFFYKPFSDLELLGALKAAWNG